MSSPKSGNVWTNLGFCDQLWKVSEVGSIRIRTLFKNICIMLKSLTVPAYYNRRFRFDLNVVVLKTHVQLSVSFRLGHVSKDHRRADQAAPPGYEEL